MPRLLLLIAVAAVFYILLRRVGTLPPHKRRAEYLKLGLGVAVVGVILLTLAGKMHWVGAALTGLLVAARQLLPVLIRVFPLLGSLGSNSSAGPKQSTVNSEILRMHLNHDTGALSGEVLSGPFKDWRLDDLSRDQLEELRTYCRDNDPESLQLLEGYLEQRFGEEAASEPPPNSGDSGGGAMTRQEALDILGLEDGADEATIVDAHRKLMQKLHPDRGGSDYLAAKINQAKDFLLG